MDLENYKKLEVGRKMPSILETNPDIAAQWHPTKNGDLKPEHVTSGSNKIVWWKCPIVTCEHSCSHEWSSVIYGRCGKKPRGCPFCGINSKERCIHKTIAHTHPDIAAQWHPTKNGDLKPEHVTSGSKLKPWWKCPIVTCEHGCSHEWSGFIYNRCGKTPTGCPFCGINGKGHCIHQTIAHTHPDIAAQWHPTKNGDLKPEHVTIGCNEMVWWLCPEKFECECPHDYQSTVANRVRNGNGCSYCGYAPKKVCIHRSIVTTHPDIIKEWHSTKNGNLKPENFSFGSNERVWWKCPILCDHGCLHEWDITINSRCSGYGCPFCAASHKRICFHMSIAHTHQDITKEWDIVKNGDLKPDNFSYSSGKDVHWICPNQHSYHAVIGNRCRNGSGCPTCKNKTQKFMFEFLKNSYIDVLSEFPAPMCKNRRVDFCIPSLNLIIELDGLQHFKQVGIWMPPENAVELDVQKMKGAIEQGYRIIRISQHDVYESSFRGDNTWTSETLIDAIEKSKDTIQYISRDPKLYDVHKMAMTK
jgi:hypothetical protein